MRTDHVDPPLPGRPIYGLPEIVAEGLDEAAKTVPISAEAASGQIGAALRLHQPPGREIFIMIAGIALAAAATIDTGNAGVTHP